MKMVITRITERHISDGVRLTYEEVYPFDTIKKCGYHESTIRPWKGSIVDTLDIDKDDHFVCHWIATILNSDDCPSFLLDMMNDNDDVEYSVDIKIVDEVPRLR